MPARVPKTIARFFKRQLEWPARSSQGAGYDALLLRTFVLRLGGKTFGLEVQQVSPPKPPSLKGHVEIVCFLDLCYTCLLEPVASYGELNVSHFRSLLLLLMLLLGVGSQKDAFGSTPQPVRLHLSVLMFGLLPHPASGI